jgi:ElaB/YqjD/DUF883 family membrane-anchored ribosome-binding protein
MMLLVNSPATTRERRSPWDVGASRNRREDAKMNDPKDTVHRMAEQARSAIADTANTVGEVANQAKNQASAAAEAVYEQGNELADVIEEAIRRNPWSAVLLAGAIGYGIARFSNWR